MGSIGLVSFSSSQQHLSAAVRRNEVISGMECSALITARDHLRPRDCGAFDCACLKLSDVCNV